MTLNQEQCYEIQWWEQKIASAISTRDPVLSNLRITLAHYDLSIALNKVLGADSGANFHTWAVWGSKKAGTTIRQEDLPCLPQLSFLIGAELGRLAGTRIVHGRSAQRLASAGGAMLGSISLQLLVRYLLNRATRQILGGNITVLADIGRATAHFICALHDCAEPDPDRLQAFLDTLMPGASQAGGQSLLREVYTHYYLARYETDPVARHERMLLANLKAILHEHIRLEPYIDGALPPPLRRIVTRRLLHFRLGHEELNVGRDVPPWSQPLPTTALAQLTNPDLIAFLSGPGGWDRTPDSLRESQARDWTDIHDRMNYICDLFRTRQLDQGLYCAPYTAAQCRAIEIGKIPAGGL